MNKFNLANFAKNTKEAVSKHSPEILTGIGIAGMVTSTVLAVKATPKAMRILEDEKQLRAMDRENGVDECFAPEEISALDTVKLCWRCYIPAALIGTASIACLIGASSVSLRRNAALATAYKLSETALSEYKEKVVETIGERKEQAIREAIDKDHLEQNPVSQNSVIVTDKGHTLCYDYQSGRYFESDIESIKKAINELNRQMLIHDYISLNELYDELGLAHVPLGNELGWRVDHGFIEPSFSSHIADDGRPAVVLSYSIAPKRGFDKFA